MKIETSNLSHSHTSNQKVEWLCLSALSDLIKVKKENNPKIQNNKISKTIVWAMKVYVFLDVVYPSFRASLHLFFVQASFSDPYRVDFVNFKETQKRPKSCTVI